MKFVRVYPGTHLSNSHEGLLTILHKDKVKSIKNGEFYIFVNNAGNAFKCITGDSGELLVYYKLPKNRSIDFNALRLLPHFFGGKDAGYTRALEHTLKKKYPKLAELSKKR